MKKTVFSIFITALLTASCSTDPTACFTINKGKDVKLNEEVQFNASCSEDADTYNWNFGDGATASGVEVKHKYTTEGTYEVTLTALNKGVSDQNKAKVIVTK